MSLFLNPSFIRNYKVYKTITDNFKPLNINAVISHDILKNFLITFIKNNDFPNILLYGLPGIGKTCLIEACLNEIYKDDINQYFNIIKINASERRGNAMLKDLLTNFINTQNNFTNSVMKIILLDEADNLTEEAQNLIKSYIDNENNKQHDIIKFVLICNYESKISESLKCRCFNYKVNKPETEEIIRGLNNILVFENINISTEALEELIKYANNDIRTIYNILQCLKLVFGFKPILKKQLVNYLNISTVEDLKIFIEKIKYNFEKLNIYKYSNLNKLLYDIYENIELKPEQLKELANLEIMVYEGINYNNFYIYLRQILLI